MRKYHIELWHENHLVVTMTFKGTSREARDCIAALDSGFLRARVRIDGKGAPLSRLSARIDPDEDEG